MSWQYPVRILNLGQGAHSAKELFEMKVFRIQFTAAASWNRALGYVGGRKEQQAVAGLGPTDQVELTKSTEYFPYSPLLQVSRCLSRRSSCRPSA